MKSSKLMVFAGVLLCRLQHLVHLSVTNFSTLQQLNIYIHMF